MARYELEFAPSVRKDLKKIDKAKVRKILSVLDQLAEDPRPSGSKKLANEDLYRLRIGDYRVLYEIHDGRLVVLIVKVGHRKDVYRN